eukprot:scaffold103379_cov19-Prasinocladus_malaysianus.AAC.2
MHDVVQLALFVTARLSVAARAQRRTVNDREVQRYEAYNQSHGAKLVSEADGNADIMEEDDW